MKVLSIDVRFEYPVHFTNGVFEPANATLAEVIQRKEPHRRHRVLVVLDQGVVDARRASFRHEIEQYFDAHGIEQVSQIVLAGGEAIKDDSAALAGLLAAMDRHHLDRQSFVLIAGCGAVRDMAVPPPTPPAPPHPTA